MAQSRIDMAFSALSDPTRRRIVEILANEEAMRVSEIAADFDSTRQAVTKHLDILCKAGLIATEWRGRDRFNRLSDGGLDPIVEWLNHYDRFWSAKFEELKGLIEKGGNK